VQRFCIVNNIRCVLRDVGAIAAAGKVEYIDLALADIGSKEYVA
jgi:hypothetical protein